MKKNKHPFFTIDSVDKIDKKMIEVWLVTGASSGFGQELCEILLARGYKVIVSSRNINDIAHFAVKYPNTSLLQECDVTNISQVTSTINNAIKTFGKIDVVVNNAGISNFTSIEESLQEESKKVFDVNFWGIDNVVKAILPQMRKQNHGLIVNFSSLCGLVPFKGVTYYCASKHALEAYSEALSDELSSLNIKVMLVEPGVFRTKFSNKISTNNIKIEDYKKIFADAIKYVDSKVECSHGTGSPIKGMNVLVDIIETQARPLRIVLGSDAQGLLSNRFNELKKQVEYCKSISSLSDYNDLKSDCPPPKKSWLKRFFKK